MPRVELDADNIETELARLGELELEELKWRYSELHRETLPKHSRIGFARLALGYAMQAHTFGGLDRASKRKLDALIAEIVPKDAAKPRPRNKTLKPGTRLLRQWKGRMYEVTVTRGGFEWDGKTWGSLTEISRTITGTNWNGWVFFGLKKQKTKPKTANAKPLEPADA
jgi:hypothetical protein